VDTLEMFGMLTVALRCIRISIDAYTRKSKFHSTRLVAGKPSKTGDGHRLTVFFSAETVQVPTMAESITEGTLKSWIKKVGDSVAADDEVATIETDKA
jgi:2-oxoglutarate dehydrogenase E2 component (dihydrolipoamide succinyltransferase)